jgi:hypothetical protein
LDYALLYGVHRNGLGPQQKVLGGVSFETGKVLSDKQIWKNVSFLVSSLAGFAGRISREFLEPIEWREEHMNLFGRSVFSDEELVSLFQMIAFLGFPETADREIDWPRITEFSHLACVSEAAIREQGTVLLHLARGELDDDAEDALLKRLGPFGNKVWITRFRSNVRDIQRVRLFGQKIGDDERRCLEKVPPWNTAPSWWGPEFDLALIGAIGDYGLLLTVTWIIDSKRPFAAHVPDAVKEEWHKLADMEGSKGKSQRPKDPGDLTFLFAEKARLARCLSVIQLVEQRREKAKQHNEEPHMVLAEMPKLPIDLGSLIVHELGIFEIPADQYPLGYKCHRHYFSTQSPATKCWYEATTERTDAEGITFKVTNLGDNGKVYTCHTSSGCWEKVIQDIQERRGKLGMPKRKHTSVSGPSMYGFSHPTVLACFRLMRQ